MKKISNTALNKIGNIVRQQKLDTEYEEAVDTLNLWREAHGKILDSYYDKCVRLAKRIDKNNIIVAQRLKRLPTIIGKLNRFKDMSLSRMQDIAGVRIIVDDMNQLKTVEKRLLTWKNLKYVKDYIENPKDSGYRGKHFIFEKNGMRVEIQLRTQAQHLWATSLETIDVFRGASLKERDDSSYWHDFFCQVSSIFAIAEGTPVIRTHNNLNLSEIRSILIDNIYKNKILQTIGSYIVTDPIINNENAKKAYYVVITLNLEDKKVDAVGFKEADYHLAFKEYKSREQNNAQASQTVLVAVSQINKIRETYPNYYMDLMGFISTINFILEKDNKK